MCGGGPLPGNPTTSTNASVPPVSLPVALNVTNSLFAIQTDLPLPGATCVVLTMRTPSYPTPYLMIPLSEGPLNTRLPRVCGNALVISSCTQLRWAVAAGPALHTAPKALVPLCRMVGLGYY